MSVVEASKHDNRQLISKGESLSEMTILSQRRNQTSNVHDTVLTGGSRESKSPMKNCQGIGSQTGKNPITADSPQAKTASQETV